MRPMADVSLIRGDEVLVRTELGHGAILGRIPSASLTIDDGRVSEAHALVSLRHGGLQLLALRRRFRVAGEVVGEATLRPGLTVTLAEGLRLHVNGVSLPSHVLGVAWPGGSAALLHDVARIRIRPEVSVRWGMDGEADARMWRVGETWRVLLPSEPARELRPGSVFHVGGVAFTLTRVGLEAPGGGTIGTQEPLRVVTFWDTVHIHRLGRDTVVLTGRGAQIMSELAMAGVPMGWRALAETLWPEPTDVMILRRRLDAALHRLRLKLGEAGIRDSLISADGHGHLEFRLEPGDRLEDRA